MSTEKKWLTRAAVCRVMRVKARVFPQLGIPVVIFGGRVRIDPEDFAAWKAGHRKEARPLEARPAVVLRESFTETQARLARRGL